MAVRLLVLLVGKLPFTPGRFLELIPVRGCVDPLLEGLCKLKNAVISLGTASVV
jgi:hypothetical protein